MLIAKGKVPSSEPWRILEVAIGQSPDVVAIRLSKELKRIHEKAVEVLVPFRRNVNGEADWIVEHVYVRGANGSLRTLARTPGIEFIRKETADNDWISRLIQEEQSPNERTLALGDFVRILTGPCARMCGHITAQGNVMTVTIELPTKRIKVHTSPNNLQALKCPPECQTFYYNSEINA